LMMVILQVQHLVSSYMKNQG